MKPRLTFLYPSRCIGGAQLLFARLAQEIVAKDLGRVSVVDYEDGFVRTYLQGCSSINFINYVEDKTIVEDTTIIVPLSHLVELRYMLAPSSLNCNFLFWSIHPDNIRHVLYGMGRKYFWKKERARVLLNSFANQGHIVFMDEANERAAENEVGSFKSALFLQIPVNIASTSQLRARQVTNVISIAWLGRITYDKINSLKKIVRDVATFQRETKIELHIIGTGSKEKELQKFAAAHGVELHQPGVLQEKSLYDYCLSKVDIGIAMGTSCLEIGALGIPVALVDYSLNKLPNDANYDWLYETANFTLGNDAKWGIARGKTLFDLICLVRNDPSNKIGTMCFDYVNNFHSLPHVAKKLVTYVEQQGAINKFELMELEVALNPGFHSLCLKYLKKIKKLFKPETATKLQT